MGPEGGKSGRPKQAVRHTKPAVDLGFQAKGGTLKKNAPSAGRCENLWGISCEKSGFYAKLFFSYFRGGEGAPWIHPWKQNAFKFKIAPQKQNSIVNSFWQEDGSLLANGILCLGTMINPPLHLSH